MPDSWKFNPLVAVLKDGMDLEAQILKFTIASGMRVHQMLPVGLPRWFSMVWGAGGKKSLILDALSGLELKIYSVVIC